MASFPFKLICVHPFHGYVRGQEVLDPDEIAAHLEDREHHFVRVAATEHDVTRWNEMKAAAAAETEAALAKAAAAPTLAADDSTKPKKNISGV